MNAIKLPGYKRNQYRAFSVLLGTFDSPDSVDADGVYGSYAMFAAPASLSCCFAETAVVSLDLVLLVTGTSCYCFIGTFCCCFLGTLLSCFEEGFGLLVGACGCCSVGGYLCDFN